MVRRIQASKPVEEVVAVPLIATPLAAITCSGEPLDEEFDEGGGGIVTGKIMATTDVAGGGGGGR